MNITNLQKNVTMVVKSNSTYESYFQPFDDLLNSELLKGVSLTIRTSEIIVILEFRDIYQFLFKCNN